MFIYVMSYTYMCVYPYILIYIFIYIYIFIKVCILPATRRLLLYELITHSLNNKVEKSHIYIYMRIHIRFVLPTVSEIPPTIASLRAASLQRQEAHLGRRHVLSHHSGRPPHSRARHRLVAATPSTWKVQRKVHTLEVEHSRS